MEKDLIAAATYRMRADKSTYEIGKSDKGTEGAKVRCIILGEGDVDTGDSIWYTGWLSDAAMPYTVKALRNMGWVGDDIFAGEGIGSLPFEGVVGHEEYEGKTYARLQFVNKPGGGGIQMSKDFSDAEKRKLAARVKAMSASVAPSSKANGGAPKGKAKDAEVMAPGNKPPF